MARYNHFSEQKYVSVRFMDLKIGDLFRKDFFIGNRRRRDIICVKTGDMTYSERKSGKERYFAIVDENNIVRSYSELIETSI